MTVTPISTAITLDQFLAEPEQKPAREYLHGEIITKPMPQGHHSVLQSWLGTQINAQGLPDRLAYAFPELRCTFGGVAIVPDLSVFRWSRIPRDEQGRVANRFDRHPDWVIEILSPDQSANQVIRKIMFCLEQGTELGWLIDPEDESVLSLQLNQAPIIQAQSDRLIVLDSLQARLSLSAQEIFRCLKLE